MTFDQLEYFLSCASCLNFSLAAKYHFVSVSTLSRNITSLEEELGVKLFNRGYHGHTLTREGKRFYNFAENVLSCQSDFWDSIGRLGSATPKEQALLRIACYPFDSMFGKIVETISGFPSDWLGKAYHVYFLKSGTMPQFVRGGDMHIGIDSEPNLREFLEKGDFEKRLFYRSPYKIVVGHEHPLAARKSIGVADLIEYQSGFNDLLPDDSGYRGLRIRSASDLKQVGELTAISLPMLIPKLRSLDLNSKLLLLPEELRLPSLRGLRNITIDSEEVYIDYIMFWNKENTDPAIRKLADMLDFKNQ